ncbi:hypothetical protein BDQ17DRAFT_550380 [Cyathus striatus]|nr:hypothetical protein BDQ17DRAFT_550380 [Cyathus striatus]
MHIPPQPYLPWKMAVTIIHVIAIAAACLRIAYRYRSRRMWWDDYAAAPPVLAECLNIIVLWARVQHFSHVDGWDRDIKVHLTFLNLASMGATVWWSRISMALAIMRITPEWSKSRTITLYVTCAFILNWIALLTTFAVMCSQHTSWQYAKTDILLCKPAFMASAANMTTDIAGDIFLAALPLYRLWRLRLPLAQRRLVRLVFSTSLIPLMGAIFLLALTYSEVINGPGSLIVWTMVVHIEGAISVIANHLTVLISWGYKACVKETDIDTESNQYVTPHWTAAGSFSNNS